MDVGEVVTWGLRGVMVLGGALAAWSLGNGLGMAVTWGIRAVRRRWVALWLERAVSGRRSAPGTLQERLQEWYRWLMRAMRRAGLPQSPALAMAVAGLWVGGIAGSAAWVQAALQDLWAAVLAGVLAATVPAGVFDLLAALRRQRVEGLVAATAFAIGTDLLRGHNPLQAVRRAAPKVPEPMRGILLQIQDLIETGADHRNPEVLGAVGQLLAEEMGHRRGLLFTRLLARAWDQPQMAAQMLLAYGQVVSAGSWQRQKAAAQVAGYRFWGWTVLLGSLLVFAGMPLAVPEAAGYLRTPEGLNAIRWWLGSAALSVWANRMASRLEGA